MSKHPISDLSQYTSTSLVEIVTNTIRKNIYNGTYAPGEKLIVRELSEQLGVSHTPIKDALNRLVSEGYVEAPPRKSMYVKPFSIMDLMETLYVRAMCELSVVEDVIARTRRTPLLLQEMKDHVTQIAASLHTDGNLDYQTWIAHDTAFHRIYMQCADNNKLYHMYSNLDSNKNCYFAHLHALNAPLSVEQYKRYIPEHQAILDAMDRADPKALCAAVGAHIITVARQYAVDDSARAMLEKITAYCEKVARMY